MNTENKERKKQGAEKIKGTEETKRRRQKGTEGQREQR